MYALPTQYDVLCFQIVVHCFIMLNLPVFEGLYLHLLICRAVQTFFFLYEPSADVGVIMHIGDGRSMVQKVSCIIYTDSLFYAYKFRSLEEKQQYYYNIIYVFSATMLGFISGTERE